MRADRLLSILLLLQVRPRVTARELARRLEVSERTIHRDMEALGAAGVPVVAERGAGEAGAIKLLAALPAVQRQGAEFVRERIHVDGAGWHASDEAAPHLATLQE